MEQVMTKVWTVLWILLFFVLRTSSQVTFTVHKPKYDTVVGTLTLLFYKDGSMLTTSAYKVDTIVGIDSNGWITKGPKYIYFEGTQGSLEQLDLNKWYKFVPNSKTK